MTDGDMIKISICTRISHPAHKLLILRSRDGCSWRQHGKHCKTSGGRAPNDSTQTCILRRGLRNGQEMEELNTCSYSACKCPWRIIWIQIFRRYPMISLGNSRHKRWAHFHHSHSVAETGSWQLGDYGLFVTVWILRHERERDLVKTLTGILHSWVLTTLQFTKSGDEPYVHTSTKLLGFHVSALAYQLSIHPVTLMTLAVWIVVSAKAMQGSTIPTCCLWCLSRG